MVYLPNRTEPQENEGSGPYQEFLSPGLCLLIQVLDTVGAVRDGEHAQALIFLGQEFGLLRAPAFTFGSTNQKLRRPHALLLQTHFYTLLRDGLVDLDNSGCLRPRYDLLPTAPTQLVDKRIAAMATLSPHEATIFATAVLQLISQGRFAGSVRVNDIFTEIVERLAADDEAPASINVAAICETRLRLISAADSGTPPA